MKKISSIIKFLFLFLFLTTPLIFTFFNSELFEIPKMYFVYLIIIIITSLHLINFSLKQVPLFRKNFLNLPILLFILSQLISTFVSIDPHTSFFGYYSRLNGGLLSVISFSLLYFIFSVYIDNQLKIKAINTILISGLLVSLYAIAQHFGIDKNFWVQDVQNRVFSTLGQPNWLAAFLVILLPISIDQFFKSNPKKIVSHYFYLINTICLYISLLFTKSKSGIIAGLISIGLYFILSFRPKQSETEKSIKDLSISLKMALIVIIFIFLSLIFPNPIKDKILPHKLDIKNSTSEINNLNITPSGDIRKIVWQGAFDLWKQYPVFGTGVETFAYSYYWTRPVEHNLTSEWDFLYNKAHNEYLNFLATTGIVGLSFYLFLIITILLKTFKNKAIFCGILAFLVTNMAGFSVVATSLLFFLLPVLVFNEENQKMKLKKTKKFFIPFIILVSLFFIQKTISFYFADIFYAKSNSYDNNSNYSTAYEMIQKSLFLRPNEPEYLTKIANLSSKLAIITKDTNYIGQSINYINQSIKISPANTNNWKQRAQIFYYLSSIDSQYFQESISSLLQIVTLAPTDAKNFYTIGQFLESAQLVDQAIPYYQKAIDLKQNYDHAYFALGQIYFDQKKYDLAQKNLELTLKYAPANTSAQELLNIINVK